MQQTINISFYQSVSIIVFILLILAFIARGVFKKIIYKMVSGHFWSDKIEAEAIVLSVNHTGLMVNRQPKVKMQMQVQPERGRNFVAEVNEVIVAAELGRYSVGTKIRVKFNPRNIKEVSLIKQETQKETPFTN